MFGTLSAGGRLRVVDTDDLSEPEVLLDVIEAEDVTFWNSAPQGMARVLPFAEVRQPAGRQSLRRVFLSGDWIPATMPDRVLAAFPRAEIVNLGGATETAVWSTYHQLGSVPLDGLPAVPYGRPIQNARYHVLDADLEPCAVGSSGSFYTSGDCLALGYWGSPRLTAERFLPDAYAPGPGQRMYDARDHGYWMPHGELMFEGRKDDQVKVRGHRVELGEVRSVLAEAPGVRDCCVLLDKRGGGRLVAFVVPTGTPGRTAPIRAFLASRLPAHMVPAKLHVIDVFPVNSNGKVDRRALLELEGR